MISREVHCPCGNTWTWHKPDHYAGKAHYPQVCPACGGAGELLKKD